MAGPFALRRQRHGLVLLLQSSINIIVALADKFNIERIANGGVYDAIIAGSGSTKRGVAYQFARGRRLGIEPEVFNTSGNLSKPFRPLPCGMIDADNRQLAANDAIRENVRTLRDHQFPSTVHASRPADLRLLGEVGLCSVDYPIDRCSGCRRIIASDELVYCNQIGLSIW